MYSDVAAPQVILLLSSSRFSQQFSPDLQTVIFCGNWCVSFYCDYYCDRHCKVGVPISAQISDVPSWDVETIFL